MKKLFVLDTNVLLHDASAIEKFADNTVVIPLVVIDEIDTFKGRQDVVGRNAREIARLLDGYRARSSLLEGVPTGAGGEIKVVVDGAAGVDELPPGLDKNRVDNQILRQCLTLKRRHPDIPVVLVSKDVNMRLRADALGIQAENYLADHPRGVPHHEAYSGIFELTVSEETVSRFYQERMLPLPEGNYLPNAFVRLSVDNSKSSAIGVVSPNRETVHLANLNSQGVWGLRPRNLRQTLALHLLLDPSLALVTLTGRAGTGKTLIALAAGLQMVVEDHKYRKLLVSRPIIAFGREIGYLPGGKEEKLTPWMAAVNDNLEFLFGSKGNGSRGKQGDMIGYLQANGMFEVEALTYMRGRSIPNQFIIIDEAQNLTPHEIKTIISRVGEGTKLVLTGDVQQIDHPFLDDLSNGLSNAIERLKGSPLVGHLTLDKGERSPLAELAASRL
ncbi:MAG: PhoH family protein [Chloroflexi bacterium]|nr:PhoH family protein [Chloroflexota bacterium]